MDIKLYYIVLHYNNNFDTIRCVESINESHVKQPHIIIVDNNSYISNSVLKECLSKYDNLELLVMNKNLGYAKANNIGYKYAKSNGADEIVIINNDTVINKDFAYGVSLLWNSEYGIVGPKIIANGINQNPLRNMPITQSECINNIKGLRRSYFFTFLPISIQSMIKRIINKHDNKNLVEDHNTIKHFDVVLHGACLIFTRNFITNFDYPFDNRTFLYMEEDILYCRSKKFNIKTFYDDSIEITHFEDGSTNVSIKSKKKKRFVIKNQLKSSKILLKVIKEMEYHNASEVNRI